MREVKYMPRIGVTAYDLLISGPSDVDKYVEVIKDCIEKFNIAIGQINNAEIVGHHWSVDSYAKSGGEPQEILNEQFVDKCDAAVAILWSRFGTPTKNYGSGTEEEIEKMLSEEKQVFMYFVDETIPESQLDKVQYDKIMEFRKKYENRGLYFVVKDENDLRKQFTNHLTMHFLPIITKTKTNYSTSNKESCFEIQDYNDNENGSASIININYEESNFIKRLEENIIKKIEEASKTVLPKRTETVKTDEGSVLSIDFSTEIEISEEWKIEICSFAEKHNNSIPDSFWNVGNLSVSVMQIGSMLGGRKNYIGTDEEKDHFFAIEEIYCEILKYNEYKQYFKEIDSFKQLRLVLANKGTTFDEDIDIKLIVSPKIIVKNDEKPIPGERIIESFIDMKVADSMYMLRKTDDIDKYTNYPVTEPIISPKYTKPLSSFTKQMEYIGYKSNYSKIINNIFCYEIFEKQDCDVLVFHVNYLKHNSKIAFPSVLLFKEKPNYIEYEIKSKHNPEVKKGKIKIL